MGLNALVVLLLADGSVLAVDLSGHVAATEVAAKEWPKLFGSCWRCAFLVDDIYTRLNAL